MNAPNVNVAETVSNTIRSSGICMLSYISTEGYPTTKALNMPRKMEPQGVYWFSTVNHSSKVDGYRGNSKASVYFVDQANFIGVSLSGTMEVIDDPAIKQTFWMNGDELFYPNGMDSDDYVILKFTAETGRLYAQIQHFNFDPKVILK